MNSSSQIQLWSQALNWVTEAVWLIDSETLTVVFANGAAQKLLGERAEAMVGRPVQEFAAAPQDVYRWQSCFDAGSEDVSFTQIVHASGRVIPVEQRIRVIKESRHPRLLLWTLSDRTEQDASERELESLLTELRATLDSAADGMLVCGAQGDIRAFNHKLAQIWNLPEALLSERNDDAIWKYLRSQVLDVESYERQLKLLELHPMVECCDVLRLRSGKVIERRGVPLRNHGVAAGRIFSFRDITQEAEIQNGLRVAAQVFESSLDAIFITDSQGVIVKANPACSQLLGGAAQVGSYATSLFAMLEPDWLQAVHDAWNSQGHWEGGRVLQRADGSRCTVSLSWVASHDVQGNLQQSIGFIRDLTQQQAAQKKIEQLAFRDALTGLHNRLSLGQHVERVLASEAANHFAVLFLDLDRFKIINDSLGHQFGDRVLKLVAQRLKSCLRPQDVLCRLGGDEFVLYLHGCQKEHSERVAKRIQEAMQEPLMLDGLGFTVQCSIGVAHYPEHGATLDELIKQADTAMYRVKANGKGHYGFYEPAMSAELVGRVQMEHALRQALDAKALSVVYQPQVDIDSGRIIGCEALLRWKDDRLGVISPGTFIPLAEESGFIVQMGAWVLEQAIKDAARWIKQDVGVKVSVNVSSLELQQPDFAARVSSLLSAYGLPACWLELELTESMLLQTEPAILHCVEHLAELGVHMVIDDFGTGYSNLAYLKRMPITKLKIDQSFVRGLPDDLSDKAIVEAVVGLGRALDVEIVAEGVESTAQRDALQKMGCRFFQGYLCAPGLESARFMELLKSQALPEATCDAVAKAR